ncbi:MAG TPA: Gfo/Idh/MocA family oxidoreductase [Anaerohalosphaeraceae bacterium]|jgi:predicted dehydrogenase|nr:Gfo/Idh/MocA family oxidoreductase [Anaerohalosphaeraceae bacterium]
MDRRSFLRRGAGVVGAAMLPAIVPASALGQAGRTPPSERVNMGFIGIGGQGGGHLMGGAWTYVPGGYVAREDVQVLAVCDVRRERRDYARQRCNQICAERLGQPGYDGVKAYNDFREVLARADIDAVLIAVPYHWAAPMAIMAMRAGKDVYCEKPVAITVRESQMIIETARRYGRIYQAGTQQRSEYGGKFRQACELVRNERIGPLKEVYAYREPGAFVPSAWTSDHSVPVPDGFDWDMWLGPLPWRPFGGEAGHTLNGLFVGDVNWSPHHYDIVQWTVNADHKAPIDIEYDNGVIHYHFTNGVVVHSTGYPGEPIGPDGGACFVGTKGRIAVDRSNIVSYPAGVLREPLLPDDQRVYFADSHSGNFLECVRSRKTTICDPEEAAYTINLILVGGISLALKRNLRWDPAKLRFVGDDTANRLLSYTPRPPWTL